MIELGFKNLNNFEVSQFSFGSWAQDKVQRLQGRFGACKMQMDGKSF